VPVCCTVTGAVRPGHGTSPDAGMTTSSDGVNTWPECGSTFCRRRQATFAIGVTSTSYSRGASAKPQRMTRLAGLTPPIRLRLSTTRRTSRATASACMTGGGGRPMKPV
jgi:hypothetical protein